MSKTFITIEEARTLARPLLMHDEKVEPFIVEVEQTQIKPVLGDTLYRDLHDDKKLADHVYSDLLSGGEYDDCCDKYHSFSGLKVAIAYMVYIKTLMCGDVESTRFGFMQKDGQYSQHISTAQRSAAYNEAMEVAQCYLRECIEYCKAKGLIKPCESRNGLVSAGCIIRKIG